MLSDPVAKVLSSPTLRKGQIFTHLVIGPRRPITFNRSCLHPRFEKVRSPPRTEQDLIFAGVAIRSRRHLTLYYVGPF